MSKRERRRLLQSIWGYLQDQMTDAYERKDEADFDWYSDGQEALFCIAQEKPIKISKRVKPL